MFDFLDGLGLGAGILGDDFDDDSVYGLDTSMQLIDLDGDGIADAATYSEFGDMDGDGITDSIITNYGFDTDQDVDLDAFISEISADIDGDGELDTSYYIAVEDTNGDGIFEQNDFIISEDLNDDGIVDAITEVSITDENSDANAENVQVTTTGDFNGDGNLDSVTEIYLDSDDNGSIDLQMTQIGTDTTGDNQIDTVVTEVNVDHDNDNIIDSTSVVTSVDIDGDNQFDDVTVLKDMTMDEFFGGENTSIDTINVVPVEEEVLLGDVLDPYAVPTYNEYEVDLTSEYIIGSPDVADDSWHQQEDRNSCAIASSEFVLEFLTGEVFNESDIAAIAEENGWYTPSGGTDMYCIEKLLDSMGVDATESTGADIGDIEECLENGGAVIVTVDSDELWTGIDDDDFFFAPGEEEDRADHAIQVTGVDYSDPDNPMVIINDSGVSNGDSATIPLDLFLDAWEDSGNFMVEAYPNDSEV